MLENAGCSFVSNQNFATKTWNKYAKLESQNSMLTNDFGAKPCTPHLDLGGQSIYVGSTVTQWLALGSMGEIPTMTLPVWSLYIFLVLVWVSSRYYDLLPHFKDM